MKIINKELLDEITRQAKESPRLRMNYNLHDNLDAKAQKLLNALEPGTILPIHRHPNTTETYLLLRGKLNVILYNDKKEVLETMHMDTANGNYGLDIPAGQWHSVEVLESGTVILEVKDGPYFPFQPEDILQ
jgi:cupin fold WbuC family metalloprotein